MSSLRIVAILFCTLLLGIAPSSAEDVLMEGGRSPDGRFEVRLSGNPKLDNEGGYEAYIRSTVRKKRVATLDVVTGGYLSYSGAKERCRALWHKSSQFVAVTDQDSRHTVELYLFEVSDRKVKKLVLPDYLQNALGRVDATEIDLHCISEPKPWQGDDLPLDLFFSVSRSDKGRLFYTCEIVLQLIHGPNSEAVVGLKSISMPKEGE